MCSACPLSNICHIHTYNIIDKSEWFHVMDIICNGNSFKNKIIELNTSCINEGSKYSGIAATITPENVCK